jgi:serine/threonine protein kinase/formylglycine-generating enzyme required for sulfatase activity
MAEGDDKDTNDPEATLELDANSKRPNASGEASFSFDGNFTEAANIGRYVDLQKLGQGAFGVVYRAQDDVLKRFVALKLLTQFKNTAQVDAWVTEARVLASLDHPAIVPVYDIGKTESGQPYIVSKLIDGGSLAERSASKTWSIDDSVRVVSQLAHALDYLHRQGVMHRDIKPGNILTTANGDAVLADFGLALPESSYGKGSRFVGTPAYMSPEQARHEGHRVDGRSDIYSLGVVLYELLTGTRPFRAKDQEELLDCIRNVEVRPLRQLNAEVPKELERICLKMLSKKVSDRYSTAADLSEDLEDWKTTSMHSVRSQATSGVAPSAGSETITPPSSTIKSASTRSLDLETIAVVPHGLRPFDSGDADFFKYLLPGARDRDGVPDSISFWVSRILSRNPAEAFRVGVLLGPSGSGKSSLMRAGVLPIVGDQVTTIFVEAKPDQLEDNLFQQIRRAMRRVANANSLRECLIQARQNGSDRRGNKLLLIIDQFEQWLNYHRDSESTELHEALRQCDGANVQAVLLVRDDFMLGISSFMDQIEELLLQNQNFATVEPFGSAHARNVLAAFGRAYGTLSEPLTSDQAAFLTEAISGLEQIGRLEPVQIALLSEMVKSKPWTPATLKELGGIQGLGVSFLEERLAGPSAHPLLRSELPVVRRILAELLPADDTIIKPPACAQSLLLERLEGIASEEKLRKLLSLIDTEVRLITPTSNTSTVASTSTGSSISDPAYQLTHDYLVPTTRKWLASLDVGTRAGRARQQLREVASAWNAKPTTKRLPSLTEWANIRWFTLPMEWTNAERRMMQATRRRLMMFGGLGAATLATLLFLSFFVYYEIHSRFLATRLLEADTSDAVAILHEIEPLQNWVLPKLASAQSNALASNKGEVAPSIEQRKQLHLGLALLDSQPDLASTVFEDLDTIDDRNLASIIGFLSSRKSIDDEMLFAQTRSALSQRQANALPLVALLSQRKPDHAEWKNLLADICDLLLRKPSTQIGFWPEMLMPIRKHLLPELLRKGEQSNQAGIASNETAVSLVSAFSQGDPATLVSTLGWAPLDQLVPLLRTCTQSNALATELRQQLLISRNSLRPSPLKLDDKELEQLLASFDGQANGQCAWAAKTPWSELNNCLDTMKSQAYTPHSLRIYTNKNALHAAITWRKSSTDTSEYTVATDLGEKELLSKFSQLQSEGFTMIDFCVYPNPVVGGASNAEPELRWAGVWRKDKKPLQQVLLLNEIGLMRYTKERLDKLPGLAPSRYSVRLDPKGELIHHSLWTSASSDDYEAIEWTRLEFAAGDLYPGYCQMDLRCTDEALSAERSTKWQETYGLDKRNAIDAMNLASRLSSCGKSAEALEVLLQSTDADYEKVPESRRATIRRGAQRIQARALARLERKEKLREFLDETISQGKFTQEEKNYLYLRLAILENEPETVTKLLNALEAVVEQNALNRDYYVRALAVIASKQFADGISEQSLQKLIAITPEWIAKDSIPADMLVDADFDGLKSKPEWIGLLQRCKLTKRFSSCLNLNEQWETTAIYSEPLAEHNRTAAQLCEEGYQPVCLDLISDSQNTNFASSVWSRRKLTQNDVASNARRIAIYALALARSGENDAIMDGLSDKWGRSVQSAIIALAPNLIGADQCVSMLRNAQTASMQATIVSTLGNYNRSQFNETEYRYLILRLTEWADSAPQSQLRNMSRWCLQNFSEKVPNQKPSQTIAADRNWYTNTIGQQMIVFTPPELVQVGRMDERRIWTHIGRRFALAATEVSGAQFEDFLNDQRVSDWIREDRRERLTNLSPPDHPQSSVSWRLAIRYCQWLNEKENIPESQWCYQDVWKNKGNEVVSAADYLERTGYRLPTHAEWEWACAGGQNEPWHFGSDEAFTQFFEWTTPHSNNQSQPIGSLRPNHYGLFDMGGNLAEWSDDYSRPPFRSNDSFFLIDAGNLATDNPANRTLCGGRFKMSPGSATSNSAVYNAPGYRSPTTGFRVARTLKGQTSDQEQTAR